MFWYLNTPFFIKHLSVNLDGSDQPFITNKKLFNIPFAFVPPLSTQKQIVSKLDALFARIDKSIGLLEENIQHTKDLMASVLDGELNSELSKNWETLKWIDVVEIKNGKNQKAVIDENGAYPIYGSGGLMAYANDYLCNEGTTIIGRKGTINKPIFVETKFWNVDTAFGIMPKDKILPKYLFYFCKNYDFTKHNKSTTLPSLAKTDLLKIEMKLPSISKQKEIEKTISNFEIKTNNLITQQSEKLKHLQSLKSSLLDRAFKGELV